MKINTELIAIAANGTTEVLDWTEDGIVAFGAGKLIALSRPLDQPCGVYSTLAIHQGSADCQVKIVEKQEELQTLTGHEASVVAISTICFGQETERFATASADGTILVWCWHEGKFVLEQTISTGRRYALSLTMGLLPESNVPFLITGNTDSRAHVYIQRTEFEKVVTLQGHADWIRCLSLVTVENPETKIKEMLLASGSQDKYVRVWRIAISQAMEQDETSLTAELLNTLAQAEVGENGLQLSTKAHLFNVDHQGQRTQYSIMLDAVVMGHDDWIYSVRWYSEDKFDSLRLLSASADRSTILWKPEATTNAWATEVRMGELGGNMGGGGFLGAVFGPNGKSVLAHGLKGSFHLWQKEGDKIWEPRVVLSGHFASVEDVAWEPHGSYLASTGLDRTTRIWSPWKTGWHEMARLQVHGYEINALAFIASGEIVSGADEKIPRIFACPKTFVDAVTVVCPLQPTTLDTLKNMNYPAAATLPALGLSNKAIDATVTVDATKILNLTHPPFEEDLMQNTLWPEINKLYGHGYEMACVATNATDKRATLVATACKAARLDHASIRLWSTSSWTCLQVLEAHTLTVTDMCFSPNGKFLLSVGRDRSWSLFENQASQDSPNFVLIQRDEKAHSRIVWRCAWSHDGSFFVTCSRDKTVKIWKNQEKWSCTFTIKFEEPVTAIALNHDSTILAIGLESGQTLLYNSKDSTEWTQISLIPKLVAPNGLVRRLCFFGNRLAAASEDFSVRIYSLQ